MHHVVAGAEDDELLIAGGLSIENVPDCYLFSQQFIWKELGQALVFMPPFLTRQD